MIEEVVSALEDGSLDSTEAAMLRVLVPPDPREDFKEVLAVLSAERCVLTRASSSTYHPELFFMSWCNLALSSGGTLTGATSRRSSGGTRSRAAWAWTTSRAWGCSSS